MYTHSSLPLGREIHVASHPVTQSCFPTIALLVNHTPLTLTIDTTTTTTTAPFSENLLEDLANVPLPDFKKREWCNKLSNYIVHYSCDFEKLESIFHYLHQ